MARNGKRLGFLPNWRIFSYVILLFNLIMLIWVIAGAVSGHNSGSSDCGTLDAQTCQDAADVGTAIGVGILITVWAVVDVILGVLWLVTNRKKTRDCPACGRDVKKGHFVCSGCGYDFRAALPGYQAQSPHAPSA